MIDSDILIIDFDGANRVLHLSAKTPVPVRTDSELDLMCGAVYKILEKLCESDRVYMIVDIGKIIIDPSLTEKYSAKIQMLKEKFIYRGGLARYGMNVTRVTIMLGYKRHLLDEQNIFPSYEAARRYIDSLIAEPNSLVEKAD